MRETVERHPPLHHPTIDIPPVHAMQARATVQQCTSIEPYRERCRIVVPPPTHILSLPFAPDEPLSCSTAKCRPVPIRGPRRLQLQQSRRNIQSNPNGKLLTSAVSSTGPGCPCPPTSIATFSEFSRRGALPSNQQHSPFCWHLVRNDAQAIDLSGYMLWTTANQNTQSYIPFTSGASVASGGTHTMCNSRIGYGG